MMPPLSIVTTLYRSAPHIEEFYRRITDVASRVSPDYELILVDDGSPDDSLSVALAVCARDPRVSVVELSRNFGHHRAMMTGLARARGDLVFLVDCDLEEQPEWLETFAERLRASNADVVYGVQVTRRGIVVRAGQRRGVLQAVQHALRRAAPAQRVHGSPHATALRPQSRRPP